jgi:SAM-dependent methyltransferase
MASDFRSWYQEHYPTDRGDTSYWWHPANPIEVVYRQQRERGVIWALQQLPSPIADLDVLDVGCGEGKPLRFLVEQGAQLDRVDGIDLIDERVQDGLRISPTMRLTVGDAGAGLPYPDASFDLVTQFVAFSSMPDQETRAQAAEEMRRVCRMGGHVLWYDTVVRKPGGIPDGIPLDAVDGLLDGFETVAHRTLHPRGLHRLAPWPTVAAVASALPGWPRTNLLLVARRVR